MWVVTTQNYVNRTAADGARESKQILEAAGIEAKVYIVGPSPLRAERLIDRCGMDERVAADVYATMKSTSILDQDGMLQIPGITAATRVQAEELAYADFHVWIAEDPTRVNEFMNQIEIVGAGHIMQADHAMRMLAFFEAQRAH